MTYHCSVFHANFFLQIFAGRPHYTRAGRRTTITLLFRNPEFYKTINKNIERISLKVNIVVKEQILLNASYWMLINLPHPII